MPANISAPLPKLPLESILPKPTLGSTQARSELWDGRIQDVIQSCRSLSAHASARPFIEKSHSLTTITMRKRMDYAHFRQLGYLIGSGTIESACKTKLAAARLKRSGARWTLPA